MPLDKCKCVQALQPGPPVFVVQRNPGGHPFDAGFGVKGVAVVKGPAQRLAQGFTYSGFARARHAHDDERLSLHDARQGQ